MNSSLKDYQGSSIPPLPNRFYSVKTFLQNHDPNSSIVFGFCGTSSASTYAGPAYPSSYSSSAVIIANYRGVYYLADPCAASLAWKIIRLSNSEADEICKHFYNSLSRVRETHLTHFANDYSVWGEFGLFFSNNEKYEIIPNEVQMSSEARDYSVDDMFDVIKKGELFKQLQDRKNVSRKESIAIQQEIEAFVAANCCDGIKRFLASEDKGRSTQKEYRKKRIKQVLDYWIHNLLRVPRKKRYREKKNHIKTPRAFPPG